MSHNFNQATKSISLILILMIFILIGCKSNGKRLFPYSAAERYAIEKDADSLLFQKEYQRALEKYAVLISIDSSYGKYYYMSGICYSFLFSYNKSIPNFKKCVSLHYLVVNSYISLACSYSSIDSEEACKYYAQKALAMDSSKADVVKKILVIYKDE